MPIISFTTDFGDQDGYIGIVKGVMLSINPQAAIVDLCHEIEPFNIRSAAFIIYNAFNYFPRGTVHLIVVDPGVGSERRGILLANESGFFVAPDNGVLSLLIEDPLGKRDKSDRITTFHLTESPFLNQSVSKTFHARDIFGPAAAHLSRGINCKELGTEIDLSSLCLLNDLSFSEHSDQLKGKIIHIDRFGNLITSIPANRVTAAEERLRTRAKTNQCRAKTNKWNAETNEGNAKTDKSNAKAIEDNWLCYLGSTCVSLNKTYHSVEKGQAVALAGSHGFIEIAVCEGNARDVLDGHLGAYIELRRR